MVSPPDCTQPDCDGYLQYLIYWDGYYCTKCHMAYTVGLDGGPREASPELAKHINANSQS